MEKINVDLEDKLKGIYNNLLAESKNIAQEIQEIITHNFGELFNEPILD
jgi:vacuolar-type H+-ATPase subunit E/Vma4